MLVESRTCSRLREKIVHIYITFNSKHLAWKIITEIIINLNDNRNILFDVKPQARNNK